MNPLKLFTVQEANAVIPRLTPLLEKLRILRDAVLGLEVEIDALELISDSKKTDSHSPLVQKTAQYQQTVADFYAVIDSIHALGCVVKDVDTGLVDFYSLYKGKVVFLCWRLSEPEIGHWHEIGGGFATRQPIEQHTKR